MDINQKFHEPKWAPIYRLLATGEPGRVFTYAELSEAAFDNDVREDRSALYAAIRRLQADNQRTAVCVKGEGYRIAFATEHKGTALKHRTKAKRSVRRGRKVLDAANRSELTQEQRQINDALGETMRKQEAMLVNHEKRINSLEKVQAVTTKRQASTDVKVEKLTAEQERLKAVLQSMGISVPAN